VERGREKASRLLVRGSRIPRREAPGTRQRKRKEKGGKGRKKGGKRSSWPSDSKHAAGAQCFESRGCNTAEWRRGRKKEKKKRTTRRQATFCRVRSRRAQHRTKNGKGGGEKTRRISIRYCNSCQPPTQTREKGRKKREKKKSASFFSTCDGGDHLIFRGLPRFTGKKRGEKGKH